MTDHFAALRYPRQPWLEPDDVQARFISLSAPFHPDRTHDAPAADQALATKRFAELNASRQCLIDPAQRLRHLLELERGSPIEQLESLPPDAANEFFQWGHACREVDQLLAQRPDPASPLLALRHFERAMSWKDALERIHVEISRRRLVLEEEIRQFNPLWESAPNAAEARIAALPLAQLEQTFRTLNYLVRWQDRVRDRLVRLSV